MSLQDTKQQLVHLVQDPGTRVIALTGKWGSGKSHLWREVKEEGNCALLKDSVYASLFGLSSIDQLKVKLILPAAGKNPGLWEGARVGWRVLTKALEGFHKSLGVLGSLSDASLALAPAFLSGKLIVLDDIERKHAKLHIDEVLGFIDEFSERYDARFLLILNTDRLEHRDAWDVLREKVVDEEVHLTTSSAEAFEIANAIRPSNCEGWVRDAVEKCGLTNIRVICKINRVVGEVLGGQASLSDAVLARTVPSTVLLSAIHYRALEGGPDVDFVLSHGNNWSHLRQDSRDKTGGEKKEDGWRLLLSRLKIISSDDYEILVAEYLRSGRLDARKLNELVSKYSSEADMMATRHACNEFLGANVWEHRLGDEELLNRARPIVDAVLRLDIFSATALHDALVEIPGGKSMAENVVSTYVEWISSSSSTIHSVESLFGRSVHPAIGEALKKRQKSGTETPTLLDACLYVARNNSWGPRQEFVMRNSTVEDMEAVIRGASTEDLQLFMYRMMEMTGQRATYVNHFGSAMDNFVEACRRIGVDSSVPRLGNLIRWLFKELKLPHNLDVVSAVTRDE